MKRLKLVIGIICCILIGQFSKLQTIQATELWTYPSLTEEQNYIWNKIYEVCRDNWDTYGVLPSVCMTQAYIESTIGEHCAGSNNLWGIKSSKSESGWANYATLEDGIIGYLEIINNGNYPNAPYCKKANYQLRYILDGNYCVPEGDYYEKGLNIISAYALTEYDDLMFEELDNNDEEKKAADAKKKREEQKRKQKKLKQQQEKLLEQQRKEAEEKAKQEAEETRMTTIQSEKSKQERLIQDIRSKVRTIFLRRENNYDGMSDILQEYMLYLQSKQKVDELENQTETEIGTVSPAPVETMVPATEAPIVFVPKK